MQRKIVRAIAMVRDSLLLAAAIIIVATLVGVLVTCTSTPAEAHNVPCGDRGTIIDRLKTGYAEKPVSVGIIENGSLVEIYASDEGTFTIIVSAPTGGSCLVAAGDSWELFQPQSDEPKI